MPKVVQNRLFLGILTNNLLFLRNGYAFHVKNKTQKSYENFKIKIKGSELIIRKVTKEDTGAWECRASNYLGSISHSFDVQVQNVSKPGL